jgi:hypothetical protein
VFLILVLIPVLFYFLFQSLQAELQGTKIDEKATTTDMLHAENVKQGQCQLSNYSVISWREQDTFQ